MAYTTSDRLCAVFLYNITITFGTEKLDGCGYPKVKNEDMFIRFDRMYERDKHTDILMDRLSMTVKAALAYIYGKKRYLSPIQLSYVFGPIAHGVLQGEPKSE